MLNSLKFILIIIVSIVLYFIDRPPIWVFVVTISPLIAVTILSLIIEKKTGKEKFNFFENTAGYFVLFCAILIPGLGAYRFNAFLRHNNIITKFNDSMLFIFTVSFTYLLIYAGILLAVLQFTKKEIKKDPNI